MSFFVFLKILQLVSDSAVSDCDFIIITSPRAKLQLATRGRSLRPNSVSNLSSALWKIFRGAIPRTSTGPCVQVCDSYLLACVVKTPTTAGLPLICSTLVRD